jgi:ATP-dependent Clp protease, protease subunit
MAKNNETNELPTLGDHWTYLFMDEFDAKSVRPVIEWIMRCNLLPDSKRPAYLRLIINSPGGSLNDAFALIDTIKGSVIPVHTLGIGQISSCGLITFMSGVKGQRVLTPNTSILSHQYSWGSYGKEHELLGRVKEFELTSQRMISLYKACTGLSETKIREVLLPPKDVWLSAEEAVELGVADRIQKTY